MKSLNPASPLPLRAVVIVAMALTLGACSRTQHITDSISGPASIRVGAGTDVVAGCPTLIANTPATASAFVTAVAMVPRFNTKNIRIEAPGDIAALPSIDAMGPCATSAVPSINFLGGHANVFLSGTTTSISGALTFGPLLFPGAALEPGVVVAQDANKNVLEIIWPQLAGTGIGAPIVRIQLAKWNTTLVSPASKIDIVWDMVVQQDAVQQFITGHCELIPMDGTAVIPGGLALPPCPATLAGGGAVVTQLASIPRWTAKALRAEIVGDVLAGTIGASGPCAAAAIPSIAFTGGTGSMKLSGTNTSVTSTGGTLTFGALLFPGFALEPGVVVASDRDKNVLEIVWPGLAGFAPGPPILRFQLAKWNTTAAVAGRSVDIALRFNAVGPDGLPAAFLASATGVVIPAQK